MSRFSAVVFDWAGTMIDYGCFAPAAAFQKLFQSINIPITAEEAREPMGLPKRDHIAALLAMPRIKASFFELHKKNASDQDIERLYAEFLPLNHSVVAQHTTMIPGALDCVAYLRRNQIKIGSTTGYPRSIMTSVLPVAQAAGYSPDTVVCGDDLIEGRPGPLMMYRVFADIGAYPPATVIKVDDTAPGIQEGVAAGCLTIGVTLSGNYVGLTQGQVARLSLKDRKSLSDKATAKLLAAGADHIIETVADLPSLMDSI